MKYFSEYLLRPNLPILVPTLKRCLKHRKSFHVSEMQNEFPHIRAALLPHSCMCCKLEEQAAVCQAAAPGALGLSCVPLECLWHQTQDLCHSLDPDMLHREMLYRETMISHPLSRHLSQHPFNTESTKPTQRTAKCHRWEHLGLIPTDVNHTLSDSLSPGLMFYPSVMCWCCITQAFLTKAMRYLCPVGAVPLVSLVRGEGKQSAALSPAHLCRDPCSASASEGNENPSNNLK